MRIIIVLCSLFVLAVGIQPAHSQESSCTNRKLAVSFRDAQNLPLQNISVTDLEAKIKGKPVKLLSLAPDPRPHRIVLALDQSGSMGSIEGESPLWRLELSLAGHFFEMNRQRAHIAFLSFNDRVDDIVDFSRGNAAVGEMLRQSAGEGSYLKTHIKGKTALRDAIFLGAQLLEHPSSADAVYVITDGGDNASKHSAAEVDQRLALTSVRLFAVLLCRSAGTPIRAPEEISGPGELAEMARKSGGEILTAAEWHGNSVALSANVDAKARSEETLSRLYQTILEDGILEIQLPFLLTKNEHWEIKLSDAARHRWKGAQITYPSMLVSCDAEVAGSGRH